MQLHRTIKQAIVVAALSTSLAGPAFAAKAEMVDPSSAGMASTAAKPQVDDLERKLAERYAAGMEGTTNALEKVIEAQANQINVFSWIVGVFGLGLALAGFGLYRMLRSTVRQAIDERVAALIGSEIDAINARSTRLHAVFLETTFSASRDIASSRQRELLNRVLSGDMDVSTPKGLEYLVKLQSEILLFPLSLVSITYSLAAGEEDDGALKEKVWMLFSEVSAGNITPRAMLKLVTVLINILHHRQTRPVVLTHLSKFAAQLRDAISSDKLPDAPSF